MTRTALIVGAGIGGLSAGLALRRAGWDVRLFERASEPRELGFGLGLAPNAMAALAELGVADTVRARGYVPRRGEIRRPDGRVIKSAQLPPEALGGPLMMALRPALHGALLEALGVDAIALGCEAAGFSVDGGRVTLRLTGGGSATGDVLIGADGMGSTIRRRLHPDEGPPRSSGIVAVRGAVHGALHHLGEESAVYYLGRGIESVMIRASDTGIYWFLSLAKALVPAGMREPAAVVAHMAPRFEHTFRAVTSATDDIRFDELFDRNPIPFWSRGPVTLLGDAAHPMLPHTGQGAAQAIVDGVTLGRLLAGGAAVEPALRTYEQERRHKTAALLGQGRRTARLMAATNPVACGLREAVIRMIPVGPLVRLMVRVNRQAGTDVRA